MLMAVEVRLRKGAVGFALAAKLGKQGNFGVVRHGSGALLKLGVFGMGGGVGERNRKNSFFMIVFRRWCSDCG